MQTIYLDISNKGVIPCIQAKQSEVGRKFLAIITDGGVPYNIPNDALLSVWYDGDSDAGNYSSIEEKSAFTIDRNKVAVEMVAQMLLKPGNGELCLSISSADGSEINTWNIPYCVEYKPGAGSTVPTEYYTALTDAAARAAEQVGLARNEAENAQSQASLASAERVAAQTAANEAKEEADRAKEQSESVISVALSKFVDIFIPVGYFFHWNPVEGSSVDLTTPENVASYFGFGTWKRIEGKFLLSASEQYLPGTEGGAETHTNTLAEMPAHSHGFLDYWALPTGTVASKYAVALNGDGEGYGNLGNERSITAETGAGEPFSIMPPYLSTYTWQRIA